MSKSRDFRSGLTPWGTGMARALSARKTMRTSLLAALALGGLTSLCVAACGAPEEETDADGAEVGTRNLTSNDFGLKAKEVVLTLDDGPGPRTVELAEFLARGRTSRRSSSWSARTRRPIRPP